MQPKIPVPPVPPLPFQPHSPGSGLTTVPGAIVPGTVMAYACDIDPTTYLRTSGNLNEPQDFGPHVNNNTGWILCDGSPVYEAEFPALFNMIGYTYGSVPDNKQFKVPDYRGFFMRGLDSSADEHNLDVGIDKRKSYSEGAKGAIDGASDDKTGVGSTQENMVQMHEHHYTNYPPQKGKVTGLKGGSAGDGTEMTLQVTTDLIVMEDGQKKVYTDEDKKKLETRPVNIYVNYLIYAGLPAGHRR